MTSLPAHYFSSKSDLRSRKNVAVAFDVLVRSNFAKSGGNDKGLKFS